MTGSPLDGIPRRRTAAKPGSRRASIAARAAACRQTRRHTGRGFAPPDVKARLFYGSTRSWRPHPGELLALALDALAIAGQPLTGVALGTGDDSRGDRLGAGTRLPARCPNSYFSGHGGLGWSGSDALTR